jgi:hypothetical protein
MRAKIGLGLYTLGALWLAAVIAYLVYLILPFGVGLLSSWFAALVAVLVFARLAHLWLSRPLEGNPVGRRFFATVLGLALATFTLDAGWTHYLVPFLPTDQDACTFGSIGPEEDRALRNEMAEKLNPDWTAIALMDGAEEEFEERMAALVSEGTSNEEIIARLHAIARTLGAQFDGGGVLRRSPSDREYEMGAWYVYKFDVNRTMALRSVLFRWGSVGFLIVRPRSDSTEVRPELAYVLLPNFKTSHQHPPRKRSCPPLPAVS